MHTAAPQVKSTSPPSSTRLRPNRSDKPPYATVKKAIDNIASDIVSCAMPVETAKASFTTGMAGMNKCSESGPIKVTEISAMKKYQRGWKRNRHARNLWKVRVRNYWSSWDNQKANGNIAASLSDRNQTFRGCNRIVIRVERNRQVRRAVCPCTSHRLSGAGPGNENVVVWPNDVWILESRKFELQHL